MKKFICFIFILFSLFTLVNMNVDAASIKIVRDPNPTGVGVLSLENDEYTIEIDEKTGIGYVINTSDNSIINFGTCKVTVIDFDNGDDYVLCYDIKEKSFGEMVITISNDICTITSLDGQIKSVIGLYTTVEIVK